MSSKDFSNRIMKVSFGDDVRRLKVNVPAGLEPKEAVASIQLAIQQGFCLPQEVASHLLLKYVDEEGDACTLIEHTFADFIAMFAEGPLRLSAELPPPHVLVANDFNAPNEADSSSVADHLEDGKGRNADATTMGDGIHGSTDQPASTSGIPGIPHGLGTDAFVDFALTFLPFAAQMVQSRRLELNQMGTAQRETLLPLCQRLVEHIDEIPEARPLRPALEGFLSGSDPDHFGDFVADLLQALTVTDSKAIVKEILRTVATDVMSVGSALSGKGHGKGVSSGASQCGWEDLFCSTGLDEGSGLKGQGKGAGPRAHPFHGTGFGMWGELLGGMLAGKGMGGACGKGMGKGNCSAGDTPPAFDLLGGLLGGMLAGKGMGGACGKGMGKGHCSAGDTPPTAAMATCGVETRPDVEQQVLELIEMGLVADPDLARDLLRTHDGDISAVVSALCE